MKKRKLTKRPKRMKRSKRLKRRNMGIGGARDSLRQEMNPMGVDPPPQVSSSQVSPRQLFLSQDESKNLECKWKISNDCKSNLRMQQSKLSPRKRKWLKNYSIPKTELDDIRFKVIGARNKLDFITRKNIESVENLTKNNIYAIIY